MPDSPESGVRDAGRAFMPGPPSGRGAEGAAQTDQYQHLPLDWQKDDIVLGVYQVLGQLGQGGMSRVFRVYHRGWRTELAAKVPRRHVLARMASLDPFEQECQAWIQLGLHPNVVTCHYVARFGGIPVIFAEHVDGGSLSRWVRSGHVYHGSEAAVLPRLIDMAVQMAWGLAHAHRHGVVHRDVKPANVLVTRSGDAKVTDFGLARIQQETHTPGPIGLTGGANEPGTGSSGMTLAYCSPEQARQEPLDKRTDVWSWAVSVLELFNGEVSWMHGQAAPAALAAYAENGPSRQAGLPRMPKELFEVLQACFANRDERPDSMDDVAQRLVGLYEEELGRPYPRGSGRQLEAGRPATEVASRVNRAVSYVELNRLLDARQALDEARALTQAHCADVPEQLQLAVAYNAALLRIRSEPFLDREDCIATMLEQTADSPPAERAYHAGLLYLEAGEVYRAIEVLSDAVEAGGGLGQDAYNARGIGLLLAGETRPAIVSFEAAAGPERTDVPRNLALAHYYDGNFRRARMLLDYLAGITVSDALDLVRHGTVMSAAGYVQDAADDIAKALSLPGQGSAVQLTAAELIEGVQNFLPGVTPVRGMGVSGAGLVRNTAVREPKNLRAQTNKETWPARFGLRTGAVIRNHRFCLPPEPSPARLAGVLASSYKALTRHHRWGELPDRGRRILLTFLSCVPAVFLVLLASAAWFSPDWHAAGLAVLVTGVGLLLLTDWYRPASRLPRTVLLVAAVCALLFSGTGAAAQAFGLGRYAPPVRAGLALTPVAYAAWQIAFRWMACLARAHPHVSSFALPGQAARRSLWGSPVHTVKTRRDDGASRVQRLTRAAAAFARRSLAQAGPGITRFRRWLAVGMTGWLVYLVPQALATVAVIGAGEFSAGSIRNGLILALPLLLAPLSPPRILLINCGFAIIIAQLLSVEVLLPGAEVVVREWGAAGEPLRQLVQGGGAAFTVVVVAAASLSAFNWLAMRNCPDPRREWSSCDLPGWDLSQVVDPLSIRRHAAPWRLVRADALSGRDGNNAEEPSGNE